MHVESDDGVRRIFFDRPAALNAMTKETAVNLAETIEETSPDEYHAIVLTVEGDVFSAGGDLESLSDFPDTARDAYESVSDTFGRVIEAMLESNVPIVAKVNGDAIGAGLALVALADIAYASDDATFSCAFVRVGLIPDTGATFMLPHIVGTMKQAMHENMARHWSEALDYENQLQVQARTSDAHEEGVTAFLENREPEFDT